MTVFGDEFSTADLAQFHVKMHIGFISAVFANALAIYLIIWKSGNMGHYKWFLMNICLTSVLFDVYISFILSPYPLVPIWGYCSTGLLNGLGLLWGAMIPLTFLVEGLGLCGLSIINALLYRLAAVLSLQHKMTTPFGITAIVMLQICYTLPSFILLFMVCWEAQDQQPGIVEETLQLHIQLIFALVIQLLVPFFVLGLPYLMVLFTLITESNALLENAPEKWYTDIHIFRRLVLLAGRMSETTSSIPNWDPTENSTSGYEDFYKLKGTIELRLDRFTKFARGTGAKAERWSAVTYIRGLAWQISAYPEEIDNKDGQIEQPTSKSLALYLYCKNKSSNTAWSCESSERIYRVLSQKEGTDDYVRHCLLPHTHSGSESSLGLAPFSTIDELLDPEKGFIKNDTVILQVDVAAETPHGIQPIDKNQLFSSSTDYQSDFELVVQGKSVHVLKDILSLHSEYFVEKFSEDNDCKNAILRNIAYEEFIELLTIIYSSFRPITVENVETVAKLAHTFKMKGILQQCEVVLMVNSNKFGRIRTFLLSYWYGMENLQAKCIEELKFVNRPNELKEELEFAALDCRAKAILMDKIVGSWANKSLADRASTLFKVLVSSSKAQSDGVLIVENNRIPIHKMYLAVYSKYFSAMFFGEFKEKSQIEFVLEEISYGDILELLSVIYPCNYPVTDENLEVILKLADRFIMPEILERCKKVLKRSQKIKRALKLYLAQRYHFSDLQMKYAKEYKNIEDAEELKAEPEYEFLDEETRSLIFDSITS